MLSVRSLYSSSWSFVRLPTSRFTSCSLTSILSVFKTAIAAWFCISISCASFPRVRSAPSSIPPDLMSTTSTSSIRFWSAWEIVPETIFAIPSSWAASSSLSPRFSRFKSIACLAKTRTLPALLSTVLRLSRVKSHIHAGTLPRR